MADKIQITLSSDKLEISPGKRAEITATIKNTGDIDQSYSITIDDIDPRWYTLSVKDISLAPGEEKQITVTIKPPLISSGEAKRYKAKLKVISKADPSIAADVPIEMPVGSLLDFELNITPEKLKGKKGSYSVNITNIGKTSATYALEAKDPYNACNYRFSQQNIKVKPGESTKVTLIVNPKEKPFRGSVEIYRFKVVVTPHGGLPYQSNVVEAELIYKPVLKTMPVFLAILAIIIFASVFNGLYSMFNSIVEGGPETTYRLTLNMDGFGSITGYGEYTEGEMASIRARAAPKWEFVEWTGDIEAITNPLSSSTSILMDEDHIATANFRQKEITPHTVYNIVFYPESPATLYYGEWIDINFDYTVELDYRSEGSDDIDIVPDAHVIPRPFTNGDLSPGYLARGYNFLNPYDTHGESRFTIIPQNGQVVVDQIRFQLLNADKSIILHEFFIPVVFTFIPDESIDLEDE